MTPLFKGSLDSPLGILEISATDGALVSVAFGASQMDGVGSHPFVDRCKQELTEYFAGERQSFSLPLLPEGTEFERSVWRELERIAFGETCSYLDIANRLRNPGAIRAVGRANGKNPIAIIVPCHRVIGSNGSLTGYGGELWRKRWLLDHEAKVAGTLLL